MRSSSTITTVQSPYGLVSFTSGGSSLDGKISTPSGTFGIKSTKANNSVNTPSAAGPGFVGIDPSPEKLNKSAANWTGALTKVHLYTNDLTANGNSSIKEMYLPYNPESLVVSYPSEFGQYGGVQREPRLYYKGQQADKITIKFIVVDRINGAAAWYDQLLDFAQPNGKFHFNTSKGSNFQAPPLMFMSYGKTGFFKGYMEHPSMEILQWDRDLMPIQAYLSFVFLSIKRQAVL